jgi:hypothetical protein
MSSADRTYVTYAYSLIVISRLQFTQSMDLFQNSPAGSSYVNARRATVNNVARDQLNIVNTTINRKFIIFLSV